jgi:hypothetical protein
LPIHFVFCQKNEQMALQQTQVQYLSVGTSLSLNDTSQWVGGPGRGSAIVFGPGPTGFPGVPNIEFPGACGALIDMDTVVYTANVQSNVFTVPPTSAYTVAFGQSSLVPGTALYIVNNSPNGPIYASGSGTIFLVTDNNVGNQSWLQLLPTQCSLGINSNTGSAGQVLMAAGDGTCSWQNLPGFSALDVPTPPPPPEALSVVQSFVAKFKQLFTRSV